MVVIYAMDTETGLTIPANQTPDMVCWTVRTAQQPTVRLRRTRWRGSEECLRRKVVTAWANGVFDFGCLVKACPESVSTIFALYREGLVYDVLIAEQLAAIGEGTLVVTLAPDSRSGPSRASRQVLTLYISSHRCTWDRMRPSIPVSGGSATGCFGMFRSRSGYRTRSSTREGRT